MDRTQEATGANPSPGGGHGTLTIEESLERHIVALDRTSLIELARRAHVRGSRKTLSDIRSEFRRRRHEAAVAN